MNWLNLLEQFITIVVFPCLGILAIYLIKFVQSKSQELQNKIDNDQADKYIQMFEDTLTTCILSTKQTYVDSLKDKHLFDEKAQKEAFKKTYDNIVKILSADAVKYLEEVHGDFGAYLTERIEAGVNLNK